ARGRRRHKLQISTGGGFQPRWRADGDELYFLGPDRKLYAAGISGGDAALQAAVPGVLFEAPVGLVIPNRSFYAPSRDGQKFALTAAIEQAQSPINVLLNWVSRLPR
ncbi:MAG: hypothetical protein ACRD44_13860, partial [Bryobacteraceae bacterium]